MKFQSLVPFFPVSFSNRWSVVVTLLLFMTGGARLRAEGENRDPKAVEVARTMMQAMGGEEAWNAAHFVRFDFKVKVRGKLVEDNAHLWDRKDGRYRFEHATKDGKRQIVLFRVADYEHTKAGEAYLDGKKMEGDAARKAVDDAYASYINDSWWLCMPWKWLAAGVNLRYLGPQKHGGASADVVELTFNHVGLTPGDMYHAFVSQKSHLMTYWEYTLQSKEKGAWDWQYGDYKGVKLASNHVSGDHKTTINMGTVHILDTVDDGFFTDASMGLRGLK
jgi:hypothetical protein